MTSALRLVEVGGEGDEGTCLVYAHRPAACRTYGFYVRRADPLCCGLVVDAVANHEAQHQGSAEGGSEVVWGNQDGIDHALERISGEARPLTTWALPCVDRQPRPSSSM